jgi:hypothetical protein
MDIDENKKGIITHTHAQTTITEKRIVGGGGDSSFFVVVDECLLNGARFGDCNLGLGCSGL